MPLRLLFKRTSGCTHSAVAERCSGWSMSTVVLTDCGLTGSRLRYQRAVANLGTHSAGINEVKGGLVSQHFHKSCFHLFKLSFL